MDIEEIREREAKASKGPWESKEWTIGNVRIFAGTHYIGMLGNSDDSHECTESNGDFVAHAREDIPNLINLIGQQAEHIQDLSDQIEADVCLLEKEREENKELAERVKRLEGVLNGMASFELTPGLTDGSIAGGIMLTNIMKLRDAALAVLGGK